MSKSISPSKASIRLVLSSPRFATYENECAKDFSKASDLYAWNAAASAALLLPSHFAEISTRNAASDALVATYGPDWPWETVFERSLPNPYAPVYSPKRDLIQTRNKYPGSPGKVIADLKLAFWESLFTARHDVRIWNHQISTVLPNANSSIVREVRNRVRMDIKEIRILRNRIAHHEPIFNRNLEDDLRRMIELISLRSAEVADWVSHMETFSKLPKT